MNHPKQIFIIGHSGAGKAVLAQALAKRLKWNYLDADFSLSPSIGLPLPDILGDQGTQAFQDTLLSILENQLTQERIVVTTDDAVICSEKGRKLLQSTFTVYLQVSVDVQLERIGHNRPLLPNNDFKYFLNTHREERDEYYKKAACFTLSSDDGDIEGHVNLIIQALEQENG